MVFTKRIFIKKAGVISVEIKDRKLHTEGKPPH